MAGTLYDYTSAATPDYAFDLQDSLTSKPQVSATESPSWNQQTSEPDDGSAPAVVTIAEVVNQYLTLQWDVLSAADAQTIIDWYCSASKGYGVARTFKLTHPTDGHVYVVRFWSNPSKTLYPAAIYAVPSVTFRVEGYVS